MGLEKNTNSRFKIYFALVLTYIVISTIVRISLYFLSIGELDFSVFELLKMFGIGFLYDSFVAMCFGAVLLLYLLLFPKKWIGTQIDKIFILFILCITLFIVLFSSFAEFPFWEEFKTRFNFIAVDYLIYTYEVIENINQSYPIPWLITALILCIGAILWIFNKQHVFKATFTSKTPFFKRLGLAIPFFALSFILGFFLDNKAADWSNNIFENEISKNGVFSFFAAFRSNELDYDLFYPTLDLKKAYSIIKQELLQENESYVDDATFDNITRKITGTDSLQIFPNIILVTIESFSADFLRAFGNEKNITPNFDSFINEGVFFSNMYATGTRTVRGMEALALSVPPTPGNSIVRRLHNDNIFSIANVLKEKQYEIKFIYGGDGYFDNMNNFFGGQGFDIVDRNRGNPLSDDIKTQRYNINDNEVSFENAWGICDEDIYNQSLKYADIDAKSNKRFFQFIMTTSNHRPYTFPDNKIDLPQGDRESAVKYTDYALGQFIEKARKKPWFDNTIFVIVADHCASSAGKWEINIEKHHIPALILNAHKNLKVDKLCSQIDLMPSVFSLMNWSYETQFYGNNIFKTKNADERALIGNYRTLGMLKDTTFVEVNDRKEIKTYRWNADLKSMTLSNTKNNFLEKKTIAYYQTASERYKNGKMKNLK